MAWESSYYVPYRKSSDAEFAAAHNLEPEALSALKSNWQNLLMQERSDRTFPGIDDKIITSWNALLIIGLMDAFDAFGTQVYLDEARELYTFIKKNSYKDAKLRHSYKPGDKRSLGFLEDYAYLARAAFRLYQITSEPGYLADAGAMLEEIQSQFPDADSPLFRFGAESGLVAKIIKTDDGVMPSPNTVVAGLFFDLGHFYYRPEYLEKSVDMVRVLQDRFLQTPENYAGWGHLLLQQRQPYYEVAISGPQAKGMRAKMARNFLPDVLLVAADTKNDFPLFDSRFDAAATRIFVCQDHTCQLPVESVEEALSQIQPGQSVFFP
jgi:uncharacterized protein YyaL (SSP411 family)